MPVYSFLPLWLNFTPKIFEMIFKIILALKLGWMQFFEILFKIVLLKLHKIECFQNNKKNVTLDHVNFKII